MVWFIRFRWPLELKNQKSCLSLINFACLVRRSHVLHTLWLYPQWPVSRPWEVDCVLRMEMACETCLLLLKGVWRKRDECGRVDVGLEGLSPSPKGVVTFCLKGMAWPLPPSLYQLFSLNSRHRLSFCQIKHSLSYSCNPVAYDPAESHNPCTVNAQVERHPRELPTPNSPTTKQLLLPATRICLCFQHSINHSTPEKRSQHLYLFPTFSSRGK